MKSIVLDDGIEYLIYDSFMNPNQMYMSLGEEGEEEENLYSARCYILSKFHG